MIASVKRNAAAYTILIASIVIVSFVGFIKVTHANPLGFFRTSAVDGTATSTLTYQTPGTATSTWYYDSGTGNVNAADKAVFALQQTGSSTNSQVKTEFEYGFPSFNSAANCKTTPTACDWYRDSTLGADSAISTTTAAANVSTPTSFVMNFASTTQGGAAGTATRTLRLLTVPTYSRYIRAVVTTPIGSTNNAVWGEFIGKKQVQ